jgi:CSLREA domain-containing protein
MERARHKKERACLRRIAISRDRFRVAVLLEGVLAPAANGIIAQTKQWASSTKKLALLLGMLAVMFAYNFAPGSSHAANSKHARFIAPRILKVTKWSDSNDGICDSDCSLREAIAVANDGDIIRLDSPTIELQWNELTVTRTLTIVGAGRTEFGKSSTLIRTSSSGVTPQGRIIYNTGDLTLVNMTITGGTAPGDYGGGIFNSGTLALINTEVTGNSAGSGGGIENRGTLNATNSTISSNTASFSSFRGEGGGIENSGTMTLVNTTVSNNVATSGNLMSYGGDGGGIHTQRGTATLRNVTIANNSAVHGYGGGLLTGTTCNVGNSIIAKNSAGNANEPEFGPDIWPSVTSINSEGYNLIGGDPLLDPRGLRNNGGATRTIALQPNSPAIDQGNGTLAGITTDQRGFTRPVDNPSIPNAPGGDASDIGAFELQAGPVISINTVSKSEGDSGTTPFTFTVSLSTSTTDTVSVSFGTADGTATAPEDYQPASGQLSFAPGETAKQITILVNGDQKIEPDETFTINLSNAVNGTINVSAGQGVGTILNDDIAGSFQFSSATYSVNENAGSAVITITRSGGSGGGASLMYATQDGTATAGKDYVATSGTMTFAANEMNKTFSIPIIDDNIVESNETVNLGLFTPTLGGTLGTPSAATLTIIDDDAAPLQLLLDESGPGPNQAAALDSVLFTRDPFPVVNGADLLNLGTDRNTRVILFVMNLHLAQGETASSVVVNLIDDNNQSYDVAAEDVRLVPNFPFTQVIFRLPNNLAVGTCMIKIKAHAQSSNIGTIRIRV